MTGGEEYGGWHKQDDRGLQFTLIQSIHLQGKKDSDIVEGGD